MRHRMSFSPYFLGRFLPKLGGAFLHRLFLVDRLCVSTGGSGFWKTLSRNKGRAAAALVQVGGFCCPVPPEPRLATV